VERARTRYTDGEIAIAYNTIGDGAGIDVLAINAQLSHLEASWDLPAVARSAERLAGLGTLTRYDRRGVGMSDAGPTAWTIADEVADALAVMDTVGIERAAVVTTLTGGAVGCLLAATHPDRVASLVLDTCTPRQIYDVDYEWALTPEQRAAVTATARTAWGEGAWIAAFAPTWARDPAVVEWMGRIERMSSSPGMMRRLWGTMNDIDVRGVLPSIRAPTLVVRRLGDDRIDRRHALYAAEHIAGARLVEQQGADSVPWGEGGDEWTDLVGEFIAGAPPPLPASRALATLLFTDIVDSTATVARIGDTEWRALLESHDVLARRAIADARGRVVKTLGDGVFARFDAVPDAVAAARALQGAASAVGVAVRAGVHIGDCELVGDDLAGRTVHEAARIAALAQAGEVLVSDAAHGLLAGADVDTHDRGLHSLKGLDDRYRLWAVM
jgi:class 3 adenylate cyclase